MVINLLSDSYQNTQPFQSAKEALLQDLPKSLEEVYNLKLLTIQANDSATNYLAIKTYLRILASNPEVEALTELHQAVIQEYSDAPCYTPEGLTERAQGLLNWDPEGGHLGFIHFSAQEFMLSHIP